MTLYYLCTFGLLDPCCVKPCVTDGAVTGYLLLRILEINLISSQCHNILSSLLLQASTRLVGVSQLCNQSTISYEKLARVLHCGRIRSSQAWTAEACVSWSVYQSLSHLTTIQYSYEL